MSRYDLVVLDELGYQIEYVEEVSQCHSEEFVIMFVDGAGWHTTKELTLPKNLSVAFLSPYSPELNPAEHVWDCIRENWFQNKTFSSLDAVEDTLVEALVSLEKDHSRVQSLTGFKWIVVTVYNF